MSVVPTNKASESLSVGSQRGHGPKEHGSRVLATGETQGSKFTESQNGRGWKGPLWVI